LSVFHFKYFDVRQEKNPMKIGTDSMLLGALIDSQGHEHALDLGAGTGVLSLMIAQKNTTIFIDAIDIHNEGVLECKVNFESSTWSDRLKVFQGNYFDYNFERNYDLIFSNPPFHINSFQSDDINLSKAKHISDYQLIDFFNRIDSLLLIGGKFWLIIPCLNSHLFLENANSVGLYPSQIITIHSKAIKRNKRLVICFERIKKECILNELIIRENDNSYTSSYRNLTHDFHWGN
jgi:tRNA1Val (adenine37-N6)-methyltransferase